MGDSELLGLLQNMVGGQEHDRDNSTLKNAGVNENWPFQVDCSRPVEINPAVRCNEILHLPLAPFDFAHESEHVVGSCRNRGIEAALAEGSLQSNNPSFVPICDKNIEPGMPASVRRLEASRKRRLTSVQDINSGEPSRKREKIDLCPGGQSTENDTIPRKLSGQFMMQVTEETERSSSNNVMTEPQNVISNRAFEEQETKQKVVLHAGLYHMPRTMVFESSHEAFLSLPFMLEMVPSKHPDQSCNILPAKETKKLNGIAPASCRAKGASAKARFTKNATVSKFCHVCGTRRKRGGSVGESQVEGCEIFGNRVTDSFFAECSNSLLGFCRKGICLRCLRTYDASRLTEAMNPSTTWTCLHCAGKCPMRASCKSYKRYSDIRREKSLKEKQQKRT